MQVCTQLSKQVENKLKLKLVAIYIEKLDVEAGETVTFDKVLFVGGENVKVGSPVVEGATVTAKVENKVALRKSSFSNTKRKEQS